MNKAKENKYNLIENFNSFCDLMEENTTFCAFDTETTGLRSETERIIEIGAVKFNKSGIIDSFGTLINPEMQIPAEASQINHITDEMVKDAPKTQEVIERFMDFSKDCILVAHNAQFDIRFVNKSLVRLEKSPMHNKAIDTLKFSRWVLPENEHWNLQHLATQFNINVESAHRAEDDARVCMEIFLKLVEMSKDLPKNWGRNLKRKKKSAKKQIVDS